MGDLADRIQGEVATNARKPRGSHPKGWEPGFEWDGRKGVIIGDPSGSAKSPAFESLLIELCNAVGLDPDHYQIVGDIQVRRWQQKPGDEYLYYHRATIAQRSGTPGTDVDLDQLLASVGKRKPRHPIAPCVSGAGLVVAMGDWQVGKSDGDGVQGTLDRLDRIPGLIEARWRELRKIGVPLEVVYLCFGGDLRESCSGHYPQQEFRTHLNNREQRKVVRFAADRIIDHTSGFAPKVAVKVVGGNHGEEREGGKSRTDAADNVDVAVIEDIAYAYSHTQGRYDHVSFAIPNEDLTLTFEHEGVIIGLAHGHQAGFGTGDPRTKIHGWWKGQMDGQQPIGDADILVTFHFHHPWLIQRGTRTHIGTAALDGGSEWFRNSSGLDAPPSTTSFVVDASGWSHLQLLR